MLESHEHRHQRLLKKGHHSIPFFMMVSDSIIVIDDIFSGCFYIHTSTTHDKTLTGVNISFMTFVLLTVRFFMELIRLRGGKER